MPIVIAQDAPPIEAATTPAASPPFWHVLLDNGLPLTILFIFLVAIVGVIVNQRRRDKCLKFFHDYRVATTSLAGRVIWGDLIVFPKGLELVFDRPHVTRRGVVKSSAMLYQAEVDALLCIARTVDGLTDREKRKRRRQIDRTFRPNVLRRFVRFLRNTLATLRDAFSKTFSLVLGVVTKQMRPGGVIASNQSSVNTLGETLIAAAGNAYEPILERHIGRPVVLKLQTPSVGEQAFIELPGYLVDYTSTYVAIFNTDHEPIEQVTLDVPAASDGGDPGEGGGGEIVREGVTLTRGPTSVTVRATGSELVVIKWYGVGVTSATGEGSTELNATLVPGATLDLRHHGKAMRLRLERTRRVDLVAPRSKAAVYFGGDDPEIVPSRPGGVAPEEDVEEASQPPAGERASG
jgi:hypothetical protein